MRLTYYSGVRLALSSLCISLVPSVNETRAQFQHSFKKKKMGHMHAIEHVVHSCERWMWPSIKTWYLPNAFPKCLTTPLLPPISLKSGTIPSITLLLMRLQALKRTNPNPTTLTLHSPPVPTQGTELPGRRQSLSCHPTILQPRPGLQITQRRSSYQCLNLGLCRHRRHPRLK